MKTKENDQTGNRDDLNHPGGEYWMAYLYDEVSRKEKTVLAAHLNECGKCRAEVERWQETMRALGDAKTQDFRVRVRLPRPMLKWGIAAAVLLFAGFSAGLLAATAQNKAMRASLKAELKTELLSDLALQQEARLKAFKLEGEQKRELDDRTILSTIERVDAARATDCESLRKELETVAVLTQDSFQRAQQQIVSLASFSQPSDKSQAQ